MSELAQFHFLRPAWLLLIPVAVAICWSLTRARSLDRVWRGVMAPHLLDHLIVRHGARSRGPTPVTLMGLAWLVAIVAVAGPVWQRQPSPFSQDQAALVIALKVTPEMLSTDVQPSRLQRSVQKIHDLLEARTGARTALIAYACSAHLVMPLTSDPDIIETFAADLTPDIMPVAGDAAAGAVALGNRLLEQSGAVGSILLITDAIASDQLDGLREARSEG
ncbi:MAG: VWA domain-containing protein, partial [Pseudomonadales bacterium]|nr:VWA domain-containing protein [Pseudomonadales bacterium]